MSILGLFVKIDSNINILGGMPDLGLIRNYLPDDESETASNTSTAIRTRKSVDRFETAIKTTFFEGTSEKLLSLLASVIKAEGISDDGRLLLFLTASANNDLFGYLNRRIFFPALYSGRAVINPDEVLACLKELKQTEIQLRKWSDYTLKLTASKYLTLLKKFSLVEGSKTKSIKHQFLSDKSFVLLIYWMMAVENRSSLLDSQWFIYSFYEKDLFIERIRQNRFSKYFTISFSGDRLKVEPIIDYKDIYYALTQPEPSY